MKKNDKGTFAYCIGVYYVTLVTLCIISIVRISLSYSGSSTKDLVESILLLIIIPFALFWPIIFLSVISEYFCNKIDPKSIAGKIIVAIIMDSITLAIAYSIIKTILFIGSLFSGTSNIGDILP